MHLNTLRPMGIALAVCTLALGGCSNDSGGSGGQSVPKMTPAASVGAGEGQLVLIVGQDHLHREVVLTLAGREHEQAEKRHSMAHVATIPSRQQNIRMIR